MTPLVSAEVPLALPFLLAWIAIPQWITLWHFDATPSLPAADAHLIAKAALAADSKRKLALAAA